ncbi:hypothetical protein F5Y10DRAFT_179608 [Nemania abortiva]|nr:hypothetical protein F5Y10DRAFT_179608 [Nemania abortiva]
MASKWPQRRACMTCLEMRSERRYRFTSVRCVGHHEPDVCSQCVRDWVRSSIGDRGTRITCPQCPVQLNYFEVQALADNDTFVRYSTLVVNGILEQEPDFVWCAHACGSGQLHTGGLRRPIMTCHHCHKATCVAHRLRYHHGFTCQEYDEWLLPEPRRRNAVAEPELIIPRPAQDDWQRDASPGREREPQFRSPGWLRSRRAQAQAQVVRRNDGSPEPRGPRRHSAVERERRAQAQELLQRERDDAASRDLVRKITMPCPKCKFDIQKKGGCDHMTCKKCGTQFTWKLPH